MALIYKLMIDDDHDGWYLCFTQSQDKEKAIEMFNKKFGYKPSQVFIDRGNLWLGPVDTSRFPVPELPRFHKQSLKSET